MTWLKIEGGFFIHFLTIKSFESDEKLIMKGFLNEKWKEKNQITVKY